MHVRAHTLHERYVDNTLLPADELMWRLTTLVRSSNQWSLVAFVEDITRMDDREAALETQRRLSRSRFARKGRRVVWALGCPYVGPAEGQRA